MRDTQVHVEKSDRKLRLQKSIISAAVPSSSLNKNRSLEYYNGDDGTGDDAYGDFGFDVSAYSLKYAGCSSVSTFSDDLAEDEDATTVFETDQYVVFRFCPADTCSQNSTYGCMDDYGEYMVPIATWLTIIAEYREEEFERYCEYCETCYGSYYNNRDLEGDDAAAADDYIANCAYKNACEGHNDVCNADDNYDWSKFFGCKQYDASDDLTLYIGPHCASDKSTIMLAAFTDDECTQYSGNKYDLATITGLNFGTDNLMDYYETDCIPCKESSLKFQNVANDADDADDITELCENMYGYAAKCNRHIGGASSSSYQSYQQEDNEYAVCSYIASVITGTYDEYGYIYVDPLSFEADNKYNQYSQKAIRKGVVTTDQGFGLAFFSLSMVGMGVYAALLHKQIKTKAEFVANNSEPLGMNRQNSGIMMARSTTVDSTYRAPKNPSGTLA